MLITFQVHNAASETSVEEFIETFTEIDPSLPKKIHSKKISENGFSFL